MTNVRSARSSEIDRAAEIGAIAFGANAEAWRPRYHEFVARYGPDSLLVAEREGSLVSSMMLIAEDMWLGSSIVPARAVCAVATAPEARRAGCAGAMMREAVHRMRAWGAATSPMWPFSYAYYRKFGWDLGGEARVTTWSRDIAFRIAPRGDVAPFRAEDLDAVRAVWDARASINRCATARSQETWNKILGPNRFGGGEGHHAMVCRQEGHPAGYALVREPGPPGEGEEAAPAEVEEIRALNPGAAVALLLALPDALPNAARFTAAFPAGGRLRSVAADPRALDTRLDANFGFRVIAPDTILRTLTAPGALEPFRIRVEDDLLGGACFEVCFEGGRARAERTRAAQQMTVAVDAFSQIASGILSPRMAAVTGLLTGDAAAIDRLHAATNGWTAPFRSGLEAG